jgi:hypothetical protein
MSMKRQVLTLVWIVFAAIAFIGTAQADESATGNTTPDETAYAVYDEAAYTD